MTRKRKWLEMLIIIMVFGLAFIGCEEDEYDGPSGVTATLLSNSNIHVTWDAVSGAKWYEIAYRTNLDSADTRRGAGSSTITTFTHNYYVSTDVTTLFYYVRAHNRTYSSEEGYKVTEWSSPVSVDIR